MKRTYDALDAWSKVRGISFAGPAWEEYDDWNDDPARLRTDIYRLLA
jgi:hypothetical protein